MTIEDIQRLIRKDEHRELEVKKTTGELKVGMHSACAFLNTDGGWLIFGIKPKSLNVLGEQVTDSTRREISEAISSLESVVGRIEAGQHNKAKTARNEIILFWEKSLLR